MAVAFRRNDLVGARDHETEAGNAFDAFVGRGYESRAAKGRRIERQRSERRH